MLQGWKAFFYLKALGLIHTICQVGGEPIFPDQIKASKINAFSSSWNGIA